MSNRCVVCSGFSIYYGGANSYLKIHRKCLIKLLEESKSNIYVSKIKRNVILKKPRAAGKQDVFENIERVVLYAD